MERQQDNQNDCRGASSANLSQWQQREGTCIDYTRHAGRANVLFADWHVESVPLTPAGLESVVIAEGQ